MGDTIVIFQHTHHLILSGQKTRTSRPMRDGEQLLEDIGAVSRGTIEVLDMRGPELIRERHVLRYKTGNTYAVQIARGQTQIARIRLLEIEPFIPAQITLEQTHAEGFSTAQEFNDLWAQMYGWEACGLLTWGLGFELVK